MAITKEKKKEIIAKLESVVAKSPALVFVNFHKLLVKDASEVRRALRKENIGYIVAKKSLIKKVFAEGKVSGDMPRLDGEMALAYLDTKEGDVIAPAREVYGFQKKLEGKLTIVGGVFDGAYKNKEEMMSLATIPSLQTLRGMFVNIVNAPIQRFAVVLNAVANK